MSYTPVSIDVYIAAFSGCISGIEGRRFITSIEPLNYENVTAIAGAYAQEFDTLFDTVSPNTLQLEMIENVSSLFWMDRLPQERNVANAVALGQPMAPDPVLPATYYGPCRAIIALIQSAGDYFSGGIPTPIPTPPLPASSFYFDTAAIVPPPGGKRLLDVSTSFIANAIGGVTICWTESLIDQWYWSAESELIPDNITIINPTANGVNPGRFIRRLIPSLAWMKNRKEWHFSSSGNDEATGLLGNPLLTDDERRRRMGPNAQWEGTDYHLRYLSDNYTCILEGQRATNAVIYIHANIVDRQGGSEIISGIATSVTALNSATNTPWSIVSASIPVSWTASNCISSPSITARLRLTSGANLNSLSFAILDQGGVAPNAQARFAEFLTSVSSFTTAPFISPVITRAGPSSGNTFIVESLRIMTRVEIKLEGPPGNSTNTVGVVFDGIQTTVFSAGLTSWYADGSMIATGLNGNRGSYTLHQTRLGLLSDSCAKSVLGGFTTNTSIFMACAANANSQIDFFTLQGNQSLIFSFLGASQGNGWLIRNLGIFDNTVTNTPIRCNSNGIIFQSGVNVYGSGNTVPIIQIDAGCTVTQSSAIWSSWTINTTSLFHVIFGPNFGTASTRSSCQAFDNTTGQYTATVRTLSFNNINTDVALGGFSNNFGGTLRALIRDPLTGAGINAQ